LPPNNHIDLFWDKPQAAVRELFSWFSRVAAFLSA